VVKEWEVYCVTQWSRILLKKLIVCPYSQIPCPLWNSMAHYQFHKGLPSVTVLSQRNLIHIPRSYFLKIHFNIIHPSMLRSSEWLLSLKLSNQNELHIFNLPYACYIPSPAHPLFDHPNKIWWVLIMKLLIMHVSPAFHHFIPLVLRLSDLQSVFFL